MNISANNIGIPISMAVVIVLAVAGGAWKAATITATLSAFAEEQQKEIERVDGRINAQWQVFRESSGPISDLARAQAVQANQLENLDKALTQFRDETKRDLRSILDKLDDIN